MSVTAERISPGLALQVFLDLLSALSFELQPLNTGCKCIGFSPRRRLYKPEATLDEPQYFRAPKQNYRKKPLADIGKRGEK
jgi:hypothetical protein